MSFPEKVDSLNTSYYVYLSNVTKGTLDESNRFHPEVNYFYASIGERDKLIFPADWDMSDLSELSSTCRRGRPTKLKVEKQEL